MDVSATPSGSQTIPQVSCECAVCKIISTGFSIFSFEEKKKIITTGRPTPSLQKLTTKNKLYTRHFQIDNYKRCHWLTGCDTRSLLFCWPCLLFSTEKNLWNKAGFSDLNNLEIIDNISYHVETRFKNFQNLKFLELMNFSELSSIPEGALESLKNVYPTYFDFVSLRSQLIATYHLSEGINKTSITALLKSLKKCGLEEACSELLKLCELGLTIPATSASSERSFSALKRIKNYIRNSTGQERLSNLALISIEKELIQKMAEDQKFYDDVIAEFGKKSRRIPVHYK